MKASFCQRVVSLVMAFSFSTLPVRCVEEPSLPDFKPMNNIPVIINPGKESDRKFPVPLVPKSVKKESEIDYSQYITNILSKARRNWFPPKPKKSLSIKIYLKIHSAGDISELAIKNSSGDVMYEQAALDAIRKSVPFNALPMGSPPYVEVELNLHYSVFLRDLATRLLSNLNTKNWNLVASDAEILSSRVSYLDTQPIRYLQFYSLMQQGDIQAAEKVKEKMAKGFYTDKVLRYSYSEFSDILGEMGIHQPGEPVTRNGKEVLRIPEYEAVLWTYEDPRCLNKAVVTLQKLIAEPR